MYKIESQKIINLLAHESKPHKYYRTKKWYIINDQSNGQYEEKNICDYGDAYILVTGNVKIIVGNENTPFCFIGPSPFTTCVLHLNEEHVETAENLELVMKHYNLIENSDNYQDTVGSLYQFKRDEQVLDDNGDLDPNNLNNSESFKYKSGLLSGLASEEDDDNECKTSKYAQS